MYLMDFSISDEQSTGNLLNHDHTNTKSGKEWEGFLEILVLVCSFCYDLKFIFIDVAWIGMGIYEIS